MFYDETTAKAVAVAIIFILCAGALISTFFHRNLRSKEEDEEPEEQPVFTYKPHKRKEYPYNFEDFIGQRKTVENLKISTKVAKLRDRELPHTLLFGMPGLGKTTLAEIIAQEAAVSFISVEGISLDSKETILSVIQGIREGTIVFIDEIHRMTNKMSEVWYKVMENYSIDFINAMGVSVIDIPKFTTIGATTDFGMLLKPFRDRFIHTYELEPYTVAELARIVTMLADIEIKTAERVASIAQYTPRLAKNYIRSMSEYAEINNRTRINDNDFDKLLHLKNINEAGLTKSQMRVLEVLATSNSKLGKLSLAMAARTTEVDLEEMIEPYLVIEGLIIRTPRGRSITEKGLSLINRLRGTYG